VCEFNCRRRPTLVERSVESSDTPRIGSSPLKAECPVFSQLPWSQKERGFGSGGAPCLGLEATRYLKIVYSRRGEVLSYVPGPRVIER
jgi:hypothetical protein